MTKLLISCDDYVYRYKGKYYAENQVKYDFYQRYLRVFEELRLVTRCIDEENLNDCRIQLDNHRIEYYPLPIFRGPKEYAARYFKIVKLLKNITEGCDAAVLRIPSTVALRTCKRVMKKKLPYAVEVVFDAHDGCASETSLINKLLWKKIDIDMRNAVKHADGASYVTEFYLQKHYLSKKKNSFKSHYSSLALDQSFYESAKVFPNHKPIVIAHTANQVQFNGRKGDNELIQAVSILKNHGIKVRVCFAGESYHGGEEKLRQLAEHLGVSDQIEFLGYLSSKQLSKFLCDADLFVFPTKAEGLPRVIIEAMAKGLPCISTNVSGNPELLPSHYLVDYYDVNTLACRIKELVTNKEAYEKASKENFENSLKYEASVLEKRRDLFYSQLKEICK